MSNFVSTAGGQGEQLERGGGEGAGAAGEGDQGQPQEDQGGRRAADGWWPGLCYNFGVIALFEINIFRTPDFFNLSLTNEQTKWANKQTVGSTHDYDDAADDDDKRKGVKQM